MIKKKNQYKKYLNSDSGVSIVRAFSAKPNLTGQIGSNLRPPSSKVISLSEAPKNIKKINNWRAKIDLQSLWHIYHAERKNNITNPLTKKILDELEISRVEILGCKNFIGIKKNIMQFYEDNISSINHEEFDYIPLISNLWLKQITDFKFSKKLVKKIRVFEETYDLDNSNLKNLLKYSIDNQENFFKASLKLINFLGINEEKDNKKNINNHEDEDQLLESELANHDQEENQEASEQDESANNIESLIENVEVMLEHQNTSQSEKSIEEEIDTSIPFKNYFDKKKKATYKIFTQEFDEIIKAKDLLSNEESVRLRNQLNNLIAPHRQTIGKLSNRLLRLIQSIQKTNWMFDLEEGILDSSKLSRIISNSKNPLSFKRESEHKFKNTTVTLLIDNSGSMRGRSINLAAVCTHLLTTTLERCQIKTEVLGFTTRDWKGGQSKQKWIDSGSQFNPGRLNDLRHIIYKSADESWIRSKKFLGCMLKDGLLKENIDGEALSWAHSRLIKRDEERKILIVISDGAPVDDSTFSANSDNFLEDHLKEIIQNIEDCNNIELLAIGIGHDVNKFYKNSVTIINADELGNVLLENLTKLFKKG